MERIKEIYCDMQIPYGCLTYFSDYKQIAYIHGNNREVNRIVKLLLPKTRHYHPDDIKLLTKPSKEIIDPNKYSGLLIGEDDYGCHYMLETHARDWQTLLNDLRVLIRYIYRENMRLPF